MSEVSKEVYLEMVSVNGMNLKFIEDQTPEICLAAIRQNPLAIKFVKEPSEALCFAAVTGDSAAILYIENPSDNLLDYVNSQAKLTMSIVKQNCQCS